MDNLHDLMKSYENRFSSSLEFTKYMETTLKNTDNKLYKQLKNYLKNNNQYKIKYLSTGVAE